MKTERDVFFETLEYYDSPEKFGYNGFACLYLNKENGSMCAVGRCLENPGDVTDSAWRNNDADSVLKKFDLKEEYAHIAYNRKFWMDLQNMHDDAASSKFGSISEFIKSERGRALSRPYLKKFVEDFLAMEDRKDG